MSTISSAVFAQDWASLERYQNENRKLGLPAINQKRIVFMGNSITEGWSDHMPEFFQGKPYVNRGISGQTTPQMHLRVRQDVINLQPVVVVILAGVNDIAGNTGPATLEEIFGNICSMAELAKAHHIKVVLCAVLPAYDFPWKPGIEPASKIIALNKMIEKYALEQNHTYLDYHSPMSDEQSGLKAEYTYDGVHPNRKGYLLMAELVDAALEKTLKEN
jgi:lysophospholipase L1-like esterase